jgi:short subunit dehydrogenase
MQVRGGLCAAGCIVSVGIGGRDEQRRAQAAAKLRAPSVYAFVVTFDVTDDASVAASARLVDERFGQLDVLNPRAAPGRRRWINVIGVVRVTNAVLPLLRRSARSPSNTPMVSRSPSCSALCPTTDRPAACSTAMGQFPGDRLANDVMEGDC